MAAMVLASNDSICEDLQGHDQNRPLIKQFLV